MKFESTCALSRLENGKQANSTLDTIDRYLDALDKQLVWVFEDCGTEEAPKPKAKKAARQRIPRRRSLGTR